MFSYIHETLDFRLLKQSKRFLLIRRTPLESSNLIILLRKFRSVDDRPSASPLAGRETEDLPPNSGSSQNGWFSSMKTETGVHRVVPFQRGLQHQKPESVAFRSHQWRPASAAYEPHQHSPESLAAAVPNELPSGPTEAVMRVQPLGPA